MARRRHTPEQVINKLREAEVAIAEGRHKGWPCRSFVVIRGVDKLTAILNCT